jgi:hypothetical protein
MGWLPGVDPAWNIEAFVALPPGVMRSARLNNQYAMEGVLPLR